MAMMACQVVEGTPADLGPVLALQLMMHDVVSGTP